METLPPPDSTLIGIENDDNTLSGSGIGDEIEIVTVTVISNSRILSDDHVSYLL